MLKFETWDRDDLICTDFDIFVIGKYEESLCEKGQTRVTLNQRSYSFGGLKFLKTDQVQINQSFDRIAFSV